MNGKDKISVIIPCYNVQKYIMRCFDSIYSQTYGFENLEVILIDDLSTDNTWSILESLQRQYPENVISLKIQKKGKCGGARNLGMDICTGKYITFVDADDYVHPDMLRVLYDRMTEDDYDVAQCGVSCFKADKPNVLEVNDFEIQRLDLDNVDNRKNLIIGLTGFTNVTAWAKLYSTKFIIEHNLRFIEDVYYEDTHFSIPDYWRIEGDNSSAKVMDRTRERARIFFTEPTHRRQVKIVDWLDDAGQVRLSEHYNRYGAIFCHTVFNKKGQKALRKFFDVTGREMIVENFVTGDILVRWQDKDWIFRSKTDFIAFFIRCAGLEDTAVYFNSLSYPFFASQALAPNGFRDALFWHEPVGDEIPGNMQIILHDQGTRAKRVFVSRRESYDRLIALGAPSDKVKQLGYIYSFVRENKHRPHILVCTNSENVGHLTELASLMPQMHFHVAAITEMSSKLMSAGQYDNVSLYPNVKMSVLDSLFEKCDFYLDINHEGEIVDAVHRAFLNNMLIVGYEETMHNAYYTADTNTFKESEYANMAEALNLTLAMPHLIDEALAMQKKAAVAADATDYMEILHL